MISSAEIEILTKISELAKRNGLKSSEANSIILFEDDHEGRPFIRFHEYPSDNHKAAKFDNMLGQLGIDEAERLVAKVGVGYPEIKAQTLGELENIVDHALSLAPRSRTR